MEIREAEVRSTVEFLSVVADIQSSGHHYWFRGSPKADYDLLPGLYWSGEQEWESNYVHAFLVGCRAYMDRYPTSPWEMYALMQHHGLPTRLLDWSRSPLLALYFALSQEQDCEGPRAVWIMPPHELNVCTIGVPSVYCPGVLETRWIETDRARLKNLDAYLPEALDPLDHGELPSLPLAIETPWSHPRVRAQFGCFTVHGKRDAPLQSYFAQFDQTYFAGRLIITGDTRQNLRVLHRWGINEETVMQDLDGLAARIRREQSQGVKERPPRVVT